MRTSASYMFDGEDDVSEVSLEGSRTLRAAIEFRGGDQKGVRQHYVRICGLSAKECLTLSKRLASAAGEIKRKGR